MNLLSGALVILGTIVSAGAQLLLKAGTNALAKQSITGPIDWAFRLASQPIIWLGILAYGVGLLIWLLVLSRLPVSVAFPMLSLGYIVTAVVAYYVFGESLGLLKIIGILVIIAGVVMVASSSS